MDTNDLSHMLAGTGADWSAVDLSPAELAEHIDSLTDQERAELGLSPRLTRFIPRRAPSWQTSEAEAEHLGQPHFKDQFSRVRWFGAQAYRQAAQLAEIDGDHSEASRLHMEAAAMMMMEEADLTITAVKNWEL